MLGAQHRAFLLSLVINGKIFQTSHDLDDLGRQPEPLSPGIHVSGYAIAASKVVVGERVYFVTYVTLCDHDYFGLE